MTSVTLYYDVANLFTMTSLTLFLFEAWANDMRHGDGQFINKGTVEFMYTGIWKVGTLALRH